MRDLDDEPADYAVAVVEAADRLIDYGQPSFAVDDRETLILRISFLRAGAIGRNEGKMLLRGCRGSKGRGPRTRLSGTMEADNLCGHIGLPFLYDGAQQLAARCLWNSFRDLFIQLRDFRLCWLVSAFATAERELASLPASPQRVTHGGSPEAIAAWNAAAFERWSRDRQAAHATYYDFLARLMDATGVDGVYRRFEPTPMLLGMGCELSDSSHSFYLACESAIRKARAA